MSNIRRTTKLKVEKGEAGIPLISAKITSVEASNTVRKTLKRSFLSGPLESITSVEPAYLPLIRCLVSYRSGITNRLRSGDIYIDPICREIVLSTSSGLRRTNGIGLLLGMSPLERKLFIHLGSSGYEDSGLASKAGLTRAQAKRALGSLVKKGIAQGRTREGNITLYSRSRGFVLDEQPWKRNAEWRPKEAPLAGERVLGSLVDDSFIGSSLSFLKGYTRIIDTDTVLYPIYIVKIAGEGRTRYCFVDALHGKMDEDLTAMGKELV